MELVENSMLGQLLEPGAEVSALARSLSNSVNYVLANTSAYFLFLLINILSFFVFIKKKLFGILFEEGDNYVLANTSAYLLFLFINIL